MGYKIAKHGNRSVSSKTGSSDVLSHLGINVDVSPETARLALDETNICFCLPQPTTADSNMPPLFAKP